jgi:hypothetical protein
MIPEIPDEALGFGLILGLDLGRPASNSLKQNANKEFLS